MVVWKKQHVYKYTQRHKCKGNATVVQHCLTVKKVLEMLSEPKLLRLQEREYAEMDNIVKDPVKNKEPVKHNCITKYKR